MVAAGTQAQRRRADAVDPSAGRGETITSGTDTGSGRSASGSGAGMGSAEPVRSTAAGWQTRIVDWDDPVAQMLIGEMNGEMSARYDPGDGDDDPDAPSLPHFDQADVICAVVADSPEDAPAGCGLLIKPAGVAERAVTGELKRIYVRSQYRGHRLAVLILDTLIEAGRRQGLQRLILTTGDRQPEAITLYRRAGWRPIPAYDGWQPFPGAYAFEYPLWDDSPPILDDRPVRERDTARALVIDDRRRVLLTHNVFPGRDHWALPGGGLHRDESPVGAASRELAEETGLGIEDLQGPVIRHNYWVPFDDHVLHQTEQIFWGRTTEHRLSRAGLGGDEDYLVDVRWWPLEDLARSDATIYPRLLADAATVVLLHGTPSRPYEITPATFG